MSRIEYLQKAARLRTSKILGVELARELSSTTHVADTVSRLRTEHQEAKTRQRFWKWAGLTVTAVLMGAIVAWLSGLFDLRPAHTIVAGALVSAMGVSLGFRESAEQVQEQCNRRLMLLRPIAGGPLCHTAAQYVEQCHPDVIAWRDIAVAERGQLHGFDVEVMHCLSELAAKTAAHEAHERAIQEACLKAHGVTSPA